MKSLLLLILIFYLVLTIAESCNYEDFFKHYFDYEITKPPVQKKADLYIIYEVNPPEGFNLRRDVYIRMAVFLNNLKSKQKFKNVKLVLPPFTKLYHWRNHDVDQSFILWRQFFDLYSLKMFTDVIDYDEFLDEINKSSRDPLIIDQIFQLKNFKEMFENGIFIDKFKIESCNQEQLYLKPFRLKWKFHEKKFSCLKFQGTTKLLEKVINSSLKTITSKPAILMFLNTEIVLHEQWGNKNFWMARRSMRFNKQLTEIAEEYRLKNFNSTNEYDQVQRPNDWRNEVYYRDAKGGKYICVHLRRGDFLYGREHILPTLKSAAVQIRNILIELGFDKIFLASDCTKEEYKDFKSYLDDFKVYRFTLDKLKIQKRFKDGELAIIDQIICSHAGYFIGTFESTFTYRIQEEREILGFKKNSTFNTLCKNEDLSNCRRNSVWPIVY